MTDKLQEFPDGGRATTVKRFKPPLTEREVTLLASCEYEHPRQVTEHVERARCRVLMYMGLLEEDPTTRGLFRQTSIGQDVVRLWKLAGWL